MHFKVSFELAADEQALWHALGLLARWFRMQPSELDALEPWEMMKWLELASEQIDQQTSDEE